LGSLVIDPTFLISLLARDLFNRTVCFFFSSSDSLTPTQSSTHQHTNTSTHQQRTKMALVFGGSNALFGFLFVGNGVGTVWNGVGMVWERCGNGVGTVWERCGNGVGTVWVWHLVSSNFQA